MITWLVVQKEVSLLMGLASFLQEKAGNLTDLVIDSVLKALDRKEALVATSGKKIISKSAPAIACSV